MRLKLLRLLIGSCCLIVLSVSVRSQNFSFNCSRDTMVPGCPTNLCITLKGIIPDLHGLTSSYTVNPASTVGGCFPVYSDPSIPGTWTTLSTDDVYSPSFPIGFDFPFYGTTYTNLKVSSNGYITFNTALSGFSHYGILNSGGSLSATSGTPQNLPSSLYAQAIVMGCYHDIDIGVTTSPNRRIQFTTVGAAPHRRWVLSFYKIPLFSGACNNLIENTHQIILYESTGIVEVTMFSRQHCLNWNQGRAMIGMQDFSRTNAIMAPGRAASDGTWGGVNMNETWRFVPDAGASLFKRVELYDLSMNLITTGTATSLANGTMDASFPNVCAPAGTTTSYIIKSVYEKIDDPAVEIIGLDTVNVNRANPLTANATTTPASCGSNTGTITVNGVTGGTPAYEYSLNNITWQSSNVFTGLAANTYTVYVRDNGAVCATTLPNVVVTVNGTISETHTTTPAVCPTSNTGSITITSAGGTGPYTFSLDGATAVPGTIPFTFSNLAPIGHTIVVNDIGTNCNTGPPIFVFVPSGAGVSGSSASTATSCPSVNNGSITITALSGTGPFTWSLDGGPAVPGTSPNTFTNVSPGSHNVVITDLNSGCASAPVFSFVATGSGITGNTGTTATACTGVNNGTITVTATSGTGPYTWSLDGAAAVPGASPYTFTNVSSGGHNVVITDLSNGCTSSPIFTSVAAGAGVNGNAATAATSCPTATNGSITVTVTTGTAPYTFSLNGGAPQAGTSPFTFNNVAAGGGHSVLVTDNNGCTFPINNITVNAGPVLTGNAVPSNTSCSGAADGSITATPTGGTAPYTFSLDGGPPQPAAASYTFTNVPAGPHNVVITDAAGCITNNIPADVVAGPQLTTTASASQALCNGSATGSITVAVPSAGTPPYQYSLDNINWQASNVFNGLVANTYTVYYQSSNGCQGTPVTVTVTAPASVAQSTATTAVVCNGQSNGIITINSSGGVPPYQYSIDGGATWQSSNTFNVPANTYTILVRDVNNCTTSPQSITVTEPAALTAAAITTNSTCNGGNDGTITVNANGGNAGYQYSLDGVNFQSSNVFNVTANTYTVTIKDNLGCMTTTPATVTMTNDLSFTPQADATICEGTSTQLQFVSNGISWSWTPATGLSSTTIPDPIANPTTTTTYTVTVTRGLCTATDDIIVNVNAAPVPDAGPDGFICYGQTYQLQGSGGSQYTWTPTTYLNDATLPNPVSSPTKTITYTLSEVIDALGCKSLTTDQVIVDVTPPIKVTTTPFDTVAYAGDQFQLNATSIANMYSWSPAIGLSNAGIANPVVTVGSVGSDIVYQVTASTIAGCKGEGYVRIKVYTGPDIYVPTAFSPNGDGKNDRFTPFPVGIKSIKYFRVFNRWGQLVFSSATLHDGWDGKMGGVEQPNGVYVWMAEGITRDNKPITKKGTITIIR